MANIFRDIEKAFMMYGKAFQQVLQKLFLAIPIPELPQFDQDLADQNARVMHLISNLTMHIYLLMMAKD